MRVVLLGPPGAGKGTQADRIAARFQLVHLATGDLLRANVADGTPLGEVAQAYLDSGELVPDQVVVAMMLERLTRPDCGHGFLLDGFPRSVAQARALDEHLAELGRMRPSTWRWPRRSCCSGWPGGGGPTTTPRPSATACRCSPARPVHCWTTTTNKACCSAWPPRARSTRSASASCTLPGTSRGVPYLPAANQLHRGRKELTSCDHPCRITGRRQARAGHPAVRPCGHGQPGWWRRCSRPSASPISCNSPMPRPERSSPPDIKQLCSVGSDRLFGDGRGLGETR